MPRLPRLHLQDVVYFVTLDGPSTDSIFKDSADYDKYLELLKRMKSEYQFKLYSYVLLPSRLHLLIEVSETYPLSVIMQKITPQYTKYYNAKYGRSGHLFPKRFRSAIVEKESNLVPLTKYIHALPRFTRVSQTPEYAYSSYAYFQNSTVSNSFVNASEVLSMFTRELKYLSYGQYVDGAGDNEMKETEKKLSRPIIGSDLFIAQIKNKIAEVKKEPEIQTQTVEPVAAAASHSRNYVRLPLLATLLFTIGLSLYGVSLNRPLFSYKSIAPIKNNSIAEPKRIQLNVSSPEPEINNLNGTIWEVELISVDKDGKQTPIKDKITFNGKSFQSYYFSSQGFSPSNYTVRVQPNGFVTWETIQTNNNGETLSWRGDWEGKNMGGVLSHHSSNQNPQDFSFFSKGINPNG